MKILVIGSGGREHALVWSLARGSADGKINSPSDNAGILKLATKADVDANDVNALADFAAREKIDLTVFGPSQAAARLEGSKIFAKEFMTRHRIPTARYRVVEDAGTAKAAVSEGSFTYQLVIKADGLSAGEGVVIAEDERQARQAIEDLMVAKKLGAAGRRLLIEECLDGREVSY